jgi:hypothetical protein
MDNQVTENVIEWETGNRKISVTLSQKKYVTKIKQLAKKYPDEVKILAKNEDGSIFARLPLKALKLNLVSRK